MHFNKSKCLKIHIGPRGNECPDLKVHDIIMKETSSEKYLGDMISSKGNEENIKFRRKIGFQSISEIMAVLKEVAAGGHYISVGLVLRDAVLKSKLLLNSEVWYGLTVKEIENLEDLDKI